MKPSRYIGKICSTHPELCGLHVEHNLRVIPAAVNLAKKNFYWPDMPEQGNTDAYRV